jgi:hypothetical protein
MCFWTICGKIYYKFVSFSSYYSTLGIFLSFTYGIFTQNRVGRKLEVHKEELKHMEVADVDHFLV